MRCCAYQMWGARLLTLVCECLYVCMCVCVRERERERESPAEEDAVLTSLAPGQRFLTLLRDLRRAFPDKDSRRAITQVG
jgi:hypothetical protein